MKKRIISLILLFSMVFTMLNLQVFSADKTQSAVQNPFSDVQTWDWFYTSVMYTYENGLFDGVTRSKFDPKGTMTRAMFVTVLGRMAEINVKDYGGNSGFTDVAAGHWAAPYVAWAAAKEIVAGTGAGKFSPNAMVTREQIAVMMVRFFQNYGIPFPEAVNDTEPKDLALASDFAKEAILKLWQCGLLQGDELGNFNPNNNATRAETATLCVRTDQIVEQWLLDTGAKEEPKEPATAGASTYYKIEFESNGGTPVDSFYRASGSKFTSLPAPNKANCTFMGWYYDEALQSLVLESDRVRNDTILYAKYQQSAPLQQTSTPVFARAIDAAASFTIQITTTEAMTAEAVQDAFTLKNISSQEDKQWASVSGSGTSFTVSGISYGMDGQKRTGFIPGSNYKLILNDDRLNFTGKETSIREYDFTIQKAEVVNVQLQSDIVNIPLSAVTGLIVNGASSTEISIPVITVGPNGSTTQDGAQTVGQFTYAGAALQVGDTVCIYEGSTAPNLKAETPDDEAAFVKITDVLGNNTYAYQGADVDSVLFMPDVLPVSVDADMDEDPENNSITVAKETLEFTDDCYAVLGLDSQTSIDIGDYIAFYSGTLDEDFSGITSAGYVIIDTITASEETWTITYHSVTQAQMQSTMDAYRKQAISGQSLLEGVNKQTIEASVEQQARESGFAQEAAQYLASMALETETFSQVSKDLNLENYSLQFDPGKNTGELRVMGRRAANVKLDVTLDATLDDQLVHFENLSGVRLSLMVGAKITIMTDGGNVEITINGSFDQEVKIDLGVDGEAIWAWAGIIPYIEEYEVTASADLYTYTDISVEAQLVTKDSSGAINSVIEDLGKQIKGLMDQDSKFLGQDTISNSLEQKYDQMLKTDSDWVTLFEEPIVENEFKILYVIAVKIGVTFKVTANANISLGMDFTYQNAKRYVYTVKIFANDVTNETIDLAEEQYQFRFYVMGTIGLRAGIVASIDIGLFSTTLASVGFAAEAGAYVQLWGYFAYELTYAASQGKSQVFSGAMLFELGVYLKITFEAQAFAGTFSYNPTLYENQWPLWSAGVPDNVRDYSYPAEDTPEIKLKSFVKNAVLPDSTFEMDYLDLVRGLDNGEYYSAIYDDANDYTIEMTNSAFTYNPSNNMVTVTPQADQPKLEGEMIITWKGQPLVFTSAPLQRRVHLYWDNLRDGYFLAFNSNGGSLVDMIVKQYDAPITKPADPTRLGYDFNGWYRNEELTQGYTIPAKMPNEDVNLYAGWTARTDTPYTVEHYIQQLNGTYILQDTDNLQGTTDATITPARKSYDGFQTPAGYALTIKPDGSSKLSYFYPRESYTVTFHSGLAEMAAVTSTFKYGQKIVAPTLGSDGYTFESWDKTVAGTMPAQNLEYTARWQARTDTPYRVEYYLQNATNDRYTLVKEDIEFGAGKTGDTVRAQDKAYENFTIKGSLPSGEITEDGKLVLKVYYDRDEFTITYDKNSERATLTGAQSADYRHGATVTPPSGEAITRPGYGLEGWYTDAACTETARFDGVMPAANMTLYANWVAGKVSYTVEHRQQNADNDEFVVKDTDNLTGDADSEVTPAVKTYDYFVAPKLQTVQIADTGTTKVTYDYVRQTFALTWNFAGGTPAETSYTQAGDVRYGAAITAPTLSKDGYHYVWSPAVAETMPAESQTYAAVWTANTYNITFDKNGGEGVLAPLTGNTYDTPVTLSANTFTRTGYHFAGWATTRGGEKVYNDGQAVNLRTADGATVTLYAVWAANTYTISYNLNGGSHSGNPTSFTIKSPTINLSAPTKSGYTFTGWTVTGENGATNLYNANIPTGSIGSRTFTANWSAITYTVQFNANGEAPKGEMPQQSFTVASGGSLNANAFICAGFTFEGWSTSASGSVQFADQASLSSLTSYANNGTVTLYGVWKPITYDIELHVPKCTSGLDGTNGWHVNTQFSADYNYYWKTVKYNEEVALPNSIKYWQVANTQTYVDGSTDKIDRATTKAGAVYVLIAKTPVSVDDLYGSGTANDPYLLYDTNGFKKILKIGTYSKYHYKLVADLDLGNSEWWPDGDSWVTLNGGSFDGNNKTISNLSLENSQIGNDRGFFMAIGDGAEVKDLHFKNAAVVARIGLLDRAGVLAGQVDTATITNVTVDTATITGRTAGEGTDYKGLIGLIYSSLPSTITGCSTKNMTFIEP